MAMPQCCYLAKGAKPPSLTTNTIKFDRIPFDPCNSIKRFDLSPFDQKNSTYLQPPAFPHLLCRHIRCMHARPHRRKDQLLLRSLRDLRSRFAPARPRLARCEHKQPQGSARDSRKWGGTVIRLNA